MIKKNFHTHSLFCDGQNTLEENVLSALRQNMTALGFSSHSYTPFDVSYCIKPENIPVYTAQVKELKNKYKGQIKLYCGFEMDYYSEKKLYDADYIIGAVHYIKVGNNYLSVDESAERQKADADKYFGGSLEKYAAAYFETAAGIADKLQPDFIAHFDLVNKFNENKSFFDDESSIVKSAWEEAVRRLCKSSIPFEINTGAMARGSRTSPYPDTQIAEFIASCGGSFILSSDCHDKNKLLFGFEKAEKQFEKYNIIDFETLLKKKA